MNTNNLWFLGIFFALSFGSWVLGQLREKAQLKKAGDEARRRYEEQLRTGRTEPTRSQPAAAASNASAVELAERRQAQLRELRKQQEVSRGGGVVVARSVGLPTQAMPKPVATPIVLGPGGIVIHRGPMAAKPRAAVEQRREAAEIAAAAQAEADARHALQQRRSRDQAARDAATARSERAEEAERVSQSRSAVNRPSGVTGVRGLLVGTGGKQVSGDELRRLFAVNEVLGKPVALRDTE